MRFIRNLSNYWHNSVRWHEHGTYWVSLFLTVTFGAVGAYNEHLVLVVPFAISGSLFIHDFFMPSGGWISKLRHKKSKEVQRLIVYNIFTRSLAGPACGFGLIQLLDFQGFEYLFCLLIGFLAFVPAYRWK